MKPLVEALCSPECAGRAPGTPGGRRARAIVTAALRDAGLDPFEQPVPGCGGANVIATIPGDADRWVLVGAHYDHLGQLGGETYFGADDNAAAIAILGEVGRSLAHKRPDGRGVILAAFDGEEPPHFLTEGMGSQRFCKQPPVPLDGIDMMVCMDLVGHALGGEGLPAGVSQTLLALGSERSAGTGSHLDSLAEVERGVIVRRVDAEVIPPLSDYDPFWRRDRPFLFLTSGRSRHYHTPRDTPDTLDFPKMEATARWLTRYVRETCQRPEPAFAFLPGGRDDASTLRTLVSLTGLLEEASEEAALGRQMAKALLADCDPHGQLPHGRAREVRMLVEMLEERLAQGR